MRDTPGDFNEGITLAAGLVSLTATVTDVNNNSASASVDVGPHLTFLDDGPIAAIAPTTATVTVDETTGLQSDDTTNAGVISLFAGVVNPGTDLAATDGAAQYAQSAAAVVNDDRDGRLVRTRRARRRCSRCRSAAGSIPA